ncbi:MAG: hypothetical protein NC548_55475 [Lachnospiraceae bacterium]|nr:hypothetical protein [Lachnospiraceae bacterium]MCM1230797.1 hypothetical protein [Ruminococcus flavefaciens]
MWHNSDLCDTSCQVAEKERKISVNQLLIDCNLGKNTIFKMGNGIDILSQNLAKIADYLEISVDYLLGRKDTPEITGGIHISSGNSGVANIGDDANISISNGIDSTTQEFLKIFNDLKFDDKFEVMQLLMKKKKESEQ